MNYKRNQNWLKGILGFVLTVVIIAGGIGLASYYLQNQPDIAATGQTGTTGKSAYDIAVDNGFVGTETEWLASLKGATGATGATGNAGATGSQGAVGYVDLDEIFYYNLFKKDTGGILDNRLLIENTLTTNNDYFVSGYIPVEENNWYVYNTDGVSISAYSAAKAYLGNCNPNAISANIDGFQQIKLTVVNTNRSQKFFVPFGSNIAYVRMSFAKTLGASIDTAIVMKGEILSVPSVETVPVGINKYYMDKKIAFYGDSITQEGGWTDKVATDLYFDSFVNKGIGTTTITYKPSSSMNQNQLDNAMSNDNRLQTLMDTDADIITIFGGVNDLLYSSVGATADMDTILAERNKATFYGAYSYIIEKLLIWKPSVQILLIVPHDSTMGGIPLLLDSFQNAVRVIANKYNLPFVDFEKDSGINTFTYEVYLRDNVHLNTAGKKKLASLVVAKLNQMNYATN